MEQLEPIISLLTGRFGWLSTVLTWAASIGFAVKLFSGRLQKRLTEILVDAATSPDTEDDLLWDRVLSNRYYKILAYTLDWSIRIKLPKLAEFQAMKKTTITEQVAEYKQIQAEKLGL